MLGGGGVEDTVDPVPVKRQVLQQLTTAHRPHLGRGGRGRGRGRRGRGRGRGRRGRGGRLTAASGLCGMGHVGKQVAVGSLQIICLKQRGENNAIYNFLAVGLYAYSFLKIDDILLSFRCIIDSSSIS